MKPAGDLLLFVLAMTLATQMTRFLPFFLPGRWLENRFVQALKRGLPPVILLLLVVYSVKDTSLTTPPWGVPEAISLAAVVALHLWRRNALLSIGAGTALYMVLVQSGMIGRIAGV